jgi:predicted PurR-regulated permease PerM
MALPIQTQIRYWGIAAVAVLVLLWVLGDVLLPFVLGGALAYLLDPIADRLERAGLSRAISVAVIALVMTLAAVLAFLLVIPTLVDQLIDLIAATPGYAKSLQTWLISRWPALGDADSTLRVQLDQMGEAIAARGAEVFNSILTGAVSFLSVILLIVIVPVVTIYMLLDWDRMIARIDELLPRDHAQSVRALASEIDATLSSFLRGQGAVCLIQGAFYAVGLMAAGLTYGLLVGVFAGLISFIPYIGALLGGALAIGLALFQFWGDWVSIGIVAGIFAAGQFIEGNFLTPKLVGSSVGLHPVWLIFALSVFGTLFGFVGLLVAVPLAAIMGVLTRFAIARYREGLLYRGQSAALITRSAAEADQAPAETDEGTAPARKSSLLMPGDHPAQ